MFVAWLQDHPPFAGYHADQLVSLSTGIVADASVNCDDAVEIGQRAASEMSGKKFRDIKLRRKDKVVTIGAKHKTVQVRGQQVEVNPTLLFNRITCVLNNSSDMESFLTFKLAPQPPALFQDGVVRKAAKSSLGLLLRSFTQQTKLSENSLYVLDGGHLLQSVIWPNPSNYAGVCLTYISYILKHYGNSTTVVFDGYGNQPSTKANEQQRRAQKNTYRDIMFEESMPTTQAAFISNGNNKKRLIERLTEKMLLAGIRVKQAQADADTLIVSTALSTAESEKLPVIVVGTEMTDVYMMCHRNHVALFNIHDIQHALGSTRHHLMFLHAVTGCNTVSAIYRQGKRKAFNIVHEKQDYILTRSQRRRACMMR